MYGEEEICSEDKKTSNTSSVQCGFCGAMTLDEHVCQDNPKDNEYRKITMKSRNPYYDGIEAREMDIKYKEEGLLC